MAVENGWGQGAVNNSNDYGKAKVNSTNGFGKIYETSNAGLTNIEGGTAAVSITYSASAFCEDASDPTPTVTGNVGAGTFSSTAGLVFVSTTTGEVDLSASTTGATYVITYTDTDSATATFSLTVNALDDASFAYSDSSYPQNFSDPTPTITGVSGGTFSGTVGLVINSTTGEIDLDASTIATHTITYNTASSGSSVCANTSTQTVNVLAALLQLDNAYSMSFDGLNDFIDCGDSDSFSFGNGTTDSPFSISAWVNMTDASRFRIASKYNQNTSQYEYYFSTSSADKLSLILHSTGGYLGRRYDTALTSYEGQWINLVCTYNGNSQTSGINLYLNGVKVDDTDIINGNYIAMDNTNEPFLIGKIEETSPSFADGKIDELSVFNVELTELEVKSIYYATETGKTADLNDLTTPPVAWYRM